MRKKEKEFIINTLKEPLGSVIARNKNKSVWIFSTSQGLEVEVTDVKTNSMIECYNLDSIEYTINYIMNEFKRFKIDYEACV